MTVTIFLMVISFILGAYVMALIWKASDQKQVKNRTFYCDGQWYDLTESEEQD